MSGKIRLWPIAFALVLGGAAEPEPVTRTVDYEVAPSPDGTRIAFISNRDGPLSLYVMNVDGSAIRRLTRDGDEDDNPSWSPDGRWLAFVSTRGGDADIHVIAADGSVRHQITRAPGADIHPAWSPGGRRLLFTSLRNSPSPDQARLDLYVIDADGYNERPVIPGAAASYASWSPGGDRMIYWRMFDGNNADIVLADADGRMLTRLTTDPAFDGWPSWSPDGRHIAFARERGEDADIYVVDLEGRARLVAGGPGRKTGPRWAPDGRSIYYSRRHERQVRIWRVAWDENEAAAAR